jgi:hypothetical protein
MSVGRKDSLPTRYVIDFHPRNQLSAQMYSAVFERIKKTVLPDRQKAANKEEQRNKEALQDHSNARINHHHQNFLKKWWLLSYPREEMILSIQKLRRYIACARVARRQIFELIDSNIYPNDKLQVFALDDDYSFGIISSSLHWEWIKAKCTTLKADYNYNTESIWDTFPWPQNPLPKAIGQVAKEAQKLRLLRRELMSQYDLSLRNRYRSLELPGKHPWKDAQYKLDEAVQLAYHMPKSSDALRFLFHLNQEIARSEQNGQPVIGPGLPAFIKNLEDYITEDSVRMPDRE